MSFQAHLDAEGKTGKTPNDLIALAKQRGYDSRTRSGDESNVLRRDGKARR